MRIALITIPGVYGAYFVREMRRHFLSAEFLVLRQIPSGAGSDSTASAGRPATSARTIGWQLVRKTYWKAYEALTLRINPFALSPIWTAAATVDTTDINDPAVVDRVRQFAPDVVLIFGGRIVRPPLLQTGRLGAMNLHGGKLPEYRGTNGIKWMLWNGDLDRVRATVHVADPELDAGAIVREATIRVRRWDSYRTIFARLHAAGVAAMVDAVRALAGGRGRGVPQVGEAHTYRARDWTDRNESLMDRRLRRSIRRWSTGRLERRAVFHAYRRLHRLAGPVLEPRPLGATVLLYHHVAEAANPYVSHLGITIAPRDFEAHVRYLTSRFDVVPYSALAGRTDDPRVVALTFDDGFESVLTEVLPIIERYRCPIKLYVCESLVEQPLTWLNQLSVLLARLSPSELQTLMRDALDRDVPPIGREPIFEFIERFVPDRTLSVLGRWFARVHPTAPPRLYLDDSQIRRVLDHPLVEVGSHTRRHLPQHRIGAPGRADDLVGAHHDLVSRFDERIRGFALPFGYRDHFTSETVADIRKVDDVVVSAYGGWAGGRRIGSTPEIPRIGAWGNLGTLWHQMARHA